MRLLVDLLCRSAWIHLHFKSLACSGKPFASCGDLKYWKRTLSWKLTFLKTGSGKNQRRRIFENPGNDRKKLVSKLLLFSGNDRKKLTAFNHPRFMGKADYWTRALFDELGMKGVSQNFTSMYLISLFVVCVNPALIIESTKEIPGDWGNNKKKVQKAFTKAVKIAKPGDIKYPKTLSLFKLLFPWILNWFTDHPLHKADTNISGWKIQKVHALNA